MTLIIRSKAPHRISFGGGGTDVAPYFEERGGCVLCSTINSYAYSTLKITRDSIITLKSLDYNITVDYRPSDKVKYDGKLDLCKAAIKLMGVKRGLEVFLHSDVPPGTGLGASSAMSVALVGVLSYFLRVPPTDYEIAQLAYNIERVEVGILGGKQDQYASTFGGFNFIEFYRDTTIVNPLRMKEDLLNELQYRFLLCYTGRQRLSAGIIEDQISGHTSGNKEVNQALDASKEIAMQMKRALLQGKLSDFGDLMNEAWEQKKRFSRKISDPHIDELYAMAKKRGAIGGKLLGAGGGGYLLLFCKFDRWPQIIEGVEILGGKTMRFSFEKNGLQTWRTTG